MLCLVRSTRRVCRELSTRASQSVPSALSERSSSATRSRRMTRPPARAATRPPHQPAGRWAQLALGRLPLFAFFLRRPFFLLPRLDMTSPDQWACAACGAARRRAVCGRGSARSPDGSRTRTGRPGTQPAWACHRSKRRARSFSHQTLPPHRPQPPQTPRIRGLRARHWDAPN
jgi:hypothetical protein